MFTNSQLLLLHFFLFFIIPAQMYVQVIKKAGDDKEKEIEGTDCCNRFSDRLPPYQYHYPLHN